MFFLVDIEGDELRILDDNNLIKLKKSVLLIELHDFIIPSDELLKDLKIFSQLKNLLQKVEICLK